MKTLMLMAFDQSGKVFNASACGENCAKWILSIGESKDLTINLRHIMVILFIIYWNLLILQESMFRLGKCPKSIKEIYALWYCYS